MLSSLVYLFVILAFSTESSGKFKYPKGLPCKIHNETRLDCSRRSLKDVPPLRGGTVKSLDLSHNQLEFVNGKSFIHLSLLQELDLSYNLVTYIAFDIRLPIRRLDLHNIGSVNINTNTFCGLPQLQILEISNIYSHYSHHQLLFHGSPFYITTSLKTIDISHSRVGSLAPAILSGLHNLEVVDVSDNQIFTLPDSVFHGLTKLTHLDISQNVLYTLLSSNLFQDLINLKYLNMCCNGYGLHLWLPNEMFGNTVNLQHLDLSDNRITSLSEKLFSNATSLEYIDLSHNHLSSLPDALFADITYLRYLDLSLNFLTSTPCKAIGHLQMLTTLDIRYNYFDYVTCPVVNMTSLEVLHASSALASNSSCNVSYWNDTNWSHLLYHVPASLYALHLSLGLHYHYIDVIDFQSVTPGSLLNSSLSSLEITYNGNLFIHNDAFGMFPYLQILNIQRAAGYADGQLILYEYAFRGILSLKSLNLQNTELSELPFKAISALANTLKHLDLSKNDIEQVSFESVNVTFQLETFDVSNNRITDLDLASNGSVINLKLTDLRKWYDTLQVHSLNSALRYLYISGRYPDLLQSITMKTPLCTQTPQVEEIIFSNLQFSDDFRPLEWFRCLNLTSLRISNSRNVLFTNATDFPRLENLTLTKCDMKSIEQQLLVSSALRYFDASNNSISSMNENAFTSLTNLVHFDLSYNQLVVLPDNQFQHLLSLIYLNLRGNKLVSLNALASLNCLQTVIVDHNALTTLPVVLFKQSKNLQYFGFGNNSFECTCNLQLLKKWILTDQKTYIDPQLFYTCILHFKNIIGITEFSLDCSQHLEYYIAPALSVLLVFCVTSALVYRYRRHIRYKLWVLFNLRRYQQYVDNDDDAAILNEDAEENFDRRVAPILRRRYHAYVAYHQESDEWVNEQLIPNIEDGPEQFKLCMKERGDVPPGQYVLNAIIHGIYKSRKTIVVLSQNYMDDGWCHYQLQIAQMRMVKDNEDVIILLQVGEIDDNKKTLLLRQILRTKGVLKWTEDPVEQELFWNQLKMKLRKPIRVDRRYQEV